jgi:outer membrane lipoprotein-sorting protein
MSFSRPLLRAAALACPLCLAGCSYLVPVKRHLPVPKAPQIVQTVTADDLVNLLNQRWTELNTLTATVEIYATETKSSQGIEKDYPSCRGYILMRKPNELRVAGTYFGKKIFDMASNGSHFKLVMPLKDLVIEGSNTVIEKSTKQWENLRPGFFLDALVVRGLEPDNEFMVASDTEMVEDEQKKHLFAEPEYTLSVMRPKSGHEKLPVRVITFHRDDLLPYGQDVYDNEGNLETQIVYSNYADYTAGKYPSRVTIKRPQEGIQIVLEVVRVEKNVDLPASQFEVTIPEGATVRTLK